MSKPYEIVNSKTGYRMGRKFDTKTEANDFIKYLKAGTSTKLHWVAKPWPYTGGRKPGETHFNPAPRSNPSDSALAGARILGVTRNRAGKVTALKLQLKAGAGGGGVRGSKTRRNPSGVTGPFTYREKYGNTISAPTLTKIKAKAAFDARTYQMDIKIYDGVGRHVITANAPHGGLKRTYWTYPRLSPLVG